MIAVVVAVFMRPDRLAPLRTGSLTSITAPGLIDTFRGKSSGERPTNSDNNNIPIKRIGDVEEIAALVNLIVGPNGGFTTGQTIHVNGGSFLT